MDCFNQCDREVVKIFKRTKTIVWYPSVGQASSITGATKRNIFDMCNFKEKSMEDDTFRYFDTLCFPEDQEVWTLFNYVGIEPFHVSSKGRVMVKGKPFRCIMDKGSLKVYLELSEDLEGVEIKGDGGAQDIAGKRIQISLNQFIDHLSRESMKVRSIIYKHGNGTVSTHELKSTYNYLDEKVIYDKTFEQDFPCGYNILYSVPNPIPNSFKENVSVQLLGDINNVHNELKSIREKFGKALEK